MREPHRNDPVVVDAAGKEALLDLREIVCLGIEVLYPGSRHVGSIAADRVDKDIQGLKRRDGSAVAADDESFTLSDTLEYERRLTTQLAYGHDPQWSGIWHESDLIYGVRQVWVYRSVRSFFRSILNTGVSGTDSTILTSRGYL